MKHLKLYGKLARFTSITIVALVPSYLTIKWHLPRNTWWILWGLFFVVYCLASFEMCAHYKPKLEERDKIIDGLLNISHKAEEE